MEPRPWLQKRVLYFFSPKLNLIHVLFVPGLNCSLIPIAQLIEEDFCDVTFTKELCVMQDLTMRNLIAVGEPRRGLYYLKNSLLTHLQVNKVVTYDILHCRLRHPSSQAFSYFLNVSSSSKKDSCDVCLCAKQTHMSFPVSENKAMIVLILFIVTYWAHIILNHFQVLNTFSP